MKYYTWILAVALFYCLATALYKHCFMHAQNDIFFYHELVSPFKQHAVQVSIYCFAGLLYLLDRLQKGYSFINRGIHFLLILYFICCLLLLSSKLVIVFSACCLVYYVFLILKAKLNRPYMLLASLFAGLVMIALVLSTQNKVSRRFNEILSGDLHLVEQQNFNPGIYFNGLQFRLLQWRFVKEILTEHQAWVTGVSDEAQTLLDEKYISTHMYTGSINSTTRGYLGYNTHDQFLEALLQTGIPGLVSFILICCAMVSLAIQRQNRELAITVFLLIAYCFNESLLETQYGVMLFTFFPLFIYYGSENKPALFIEVN
ncbi:MAG: O-antigen ligase family protein [Chitinophagaceae bacterium]